MPWLRAGSCLAAGLVGGAGGLIGALPSLDGVIVLAVGAAGAAATLAAGWLRRIRANEAADRWLAHGTGTRPSAATLLRRCEELTDANSRRTLARALRRVLSDADASPVRGTRLAVDRRSVLAQRPALEQLAARLDDFDQVVTPSAMALVEELVTSGGSPLYAGTAISPRQLREVLAQTAFELDMAQPQPEVGAHA
jgi:hypothetical protein